MAETTSPIAIVGIGCLFPGAPDLATYWGNILAARDGITDVPLGHSWRVEDFHDSDPQTADKSWATRGGFLDPVPFDSMAFGIPPNQLESIDTTQLLSLVVARECLRDAGFDPDGAGWDRSRTSTILGVTGTQEMAVSLGSRLHGPTWRKSMIRCGIDPALADVVARDIGAHMPVWTEQSFPGLLGNVVAGRIANRLDLGGTNCVVDAACGSSLAAVQYAVDELRFGRSDLALTGGADTLNDAFMFQCFTRTPALSQKNEARPFDAHSDGILIGEGIAILALMRLADARATGRRVYAVLHAVGSSSDGRYKSIYAPNPAGQVKALRRALAAASFDPASVGLIEAHGTGTRAGDAAELEALVDVYGGAGGRVRLGSVKAQIGHTKSTAGAAGLVKAALALHERVLPPMAKVQTPSPKLVGTRFDLSPVADPWVHGAATPRRAAVSAFGFGGSNFHALLEEDVGTSPSAFDDGVGLFLIGADSVAELDVSLVAVMEDAPTFAHRVRSCAQRWRSGCRFVAAFVATASDVGARVAEARTLTRTGDRGDAVWIGHDLQTVSPVFLFPGQGSQSVGMGRSAAVAWPTFREALDRVESQCLALGQQSVTDVVWPAHAWTEAQSVAAEARLVATENAQPAIGALSVAWAALLASFGVVPTEVCGHSYGELVALHVAGAYDLGALMRLSAERGAAMAGASRGGMAAVSAPLPVLEAALTGTPVVLANRNHPEQGVLSGAHDALRAVTTRLEAAGHTVKPLAVSAAFHSPLVADAAVPFAAALDGVVVVAPSLPVWSNATATPYPSDPGAIRACLATQITSPVRFSEIVDGLYAAGQRVFVECGPRDVLTRLVHRNLRGRPHVAVAVDAVNEPRALLMALAALAAAGVPVNLAPLLSRRLPDPPRFATRTSVPIAGANFRNPSTLEPPMPKLPPPAHEGWSAIPTTAAPVAAPPRLADSLTGGHAPTPVAMSGDVAALLDATRRALVAFEELQVKTAEVHAKFLDQADRANATFHTLFQAQAALLGAVGIGASSAVARPVSPVAAGVIPRTPERPPDVPAGLVALLEGRGIGSGGGTSVASPSYLPPILDAKGALTKRPTEAPTGSVAIDFDLASVVLASVAAKTGYPRDLLELRMDLESDLGVDSIKRVEILSAVSEEVPGLPELDNERMAGLRTLQQVVDYLKSIARPPTNGASPGPIVPDLLRPKTPLQRDVIVAALLSAVAEKTGYPRDLLELRMDLESDLGVDSIKRVEILGAVQERVAGLPEADNDTLSRLRTLGAIVDHLTELGNGLGFASVGADRAPTETSGLLVAPPAPVVAVATDPGPPLVQLASDLVTRRSLQRRVVGRVPVAAEAWGWPSPVVLSGEGAAAAVHELAVRGVHARQDVDGVTGASTVILCGATTRAAFALARQLPPEVSLAAVGDDPGLPGLIRTLRLERPGARFLAVSGELSGLWVGPGVADVRTQGGLTTTADRVVPLAGEPIPPVGRGDLVVVTGGARGVTAAVVLAMARRWGCDWLVVGRTSENPDPAWAIGVADRGLEGAALAFLQGQGARPTPRAVAEAAMAVRASREVRTTLAALSATGGRVDLLATDVRDGAALSAALVGRKVKGVVHGAGVLADKLVSDKTDEQFERVWSTKVDGWTALWGAVCAHQPEFVLLFASISGRQGNRGQADYAAANEVLCDTARQLRAEGIRATAVCWGPWGGGMVNAGLAKHFGSLGMAPIPVADGAGAAVDEVERGSDPVVVLEAPRPGSGRMVLWVDPAAPELNQHRLRGSAVWPIAFVAETLLTLGQQVKPGTVLAVRDLLVARGLTMSERVAVELGWAEEGDDLAVELHAEGRLRYRARLVSASATREPRPTTGLSGRTFPLDLPRAYADWLFHGPVFRRIASISGWSDAGIVGVVRASQPSDLGRPASGWSADPLTVDCVLQLMVLWVRASRGHAALPTGLDRLDVFGPLPESVDVAVWTTARARGGRFDAEVCAGGHVLLAMGGTWAEDERLDAEFVAPV